MLLKFLSTKSQSITPISSCSPKIFCNFGFIKTNEWKFQEKHKWLMVNLFPYPCLVVEKIFSGYKLDVLWIKNKNVFMVLFYTWILNMFGLPQWDGFDRNERWEWVVCCEGWIMKLKFVSWNKMSFQESKMD